MDERALVTGGTGFVGRHALPELLERGYEVHAVSRTGAGPHADAVRWHRADLLDEEDRLRVLHDVRPARLLHLAWTIEHGAYWTSPDNLRWVAASIELARTFAEHGGRRFVAAGTCAEYAWSGERLDEGAPLDPTSPYAVAKNATRMLLEAFAKPLGLSFAWGRIFFVYGPDEDRRRLIPSIIRALRDGEDLAVSREHVRDFACTPDIGGGFAALLDSDVEGTVNVCTGEGVSVGQIVEGVAGALSVDPIGIGSRPASKAAAIVGDAHRLNDEVGFAPRHTLAQGLAETVAWWEAQR